MNSPTAPTPAPPHPPTPSLTLPTGRAIPQLGFGTYKIAPEDAYDAVRAALDTGYRHIDTAQMYGNEAEVGRAIEASGIPREELFVTSKLDNGNHRPEAAAASIARSLEDLRLASLDLFLVHWPLPTLYDGDVALPWPALEDAYRAGECLAIGLSNYETAHMRAVMDRAAVKPHAIQVESHPYMPNSTILRFAQRHRMVFEAWSPLARGRAARDPLLASIGARYGAEAAQVALRWAIQRGHVVFPKSVRPDRMAANFDVFGFELAPADMDAINALNEGEKGRTGSHPATMDRM